MRLAINGGVSFPVKAIQYTSSFCAKPAFWIASRRLKMFFTSPAGKTRIINTGKTPIKCFRFQFKDETVILLRTCKFIEQFYVNRFQNVNYKMSLDNGGLILEILWTKILSRQSCSLATFRNVSFWVNENITQEVALNLIVYTCFFFCKRRFLFTG